jgi:hypothetical protein
MFLIFLIPCVLSFSQQKYLHLLVHAHSAAAIIIIIIIIIESRDSSVGIAVGCGLDDRGSRVRFPAGAGNFSLLHRFQTGFGLTQPPIQWVPGALSLGVKRPGSEADDSLLVPGLRMRDPVPLAHNTSSWHGA